MCILLQPRSGFARYFLPPFSPAQMPDLIKVKCMCDVTLIIVPSAQLCDPAVFPEDSTAFSPLCSLSFPCQKSCISDLPYLLFSCLHSCLFPLAHCNPIRILTPLPIISHCPILPLDFFLSAKYLSASLTGTTLTQTILDSSPASSWSHVLFMHSLCIISTQCPQTLWFLALEASLC